MKKLILFLTILNLSLFAQDIPNAGFENWTAGNPDGWFVDNIPGFYVPVTQSAESHSGSYAVRLGVVSYITGTLPGYMWSGQNFLEGFPVSQAHGSLTGFYQFNSADNDEFYALVYMQKGQSIVGVGSLFVSATTSGGYNQLTVPIEYFSSEVPDTAFIWFSVADSSDNQASVSTYALLDDLSWGAVVGVEKVNSNIPAEFAMQQNYPNPFNPSTIIEYSIPKESFVELKVYDIIGNELTTLVSEYQPAGRFIAEFNAANLSSGIYIAKLTAGSFTRSLKMTLLR